MRRFGWAMFAAVLVLTLTVGSAYADCGKCPEKAACPGAEKAACGEKAAPACGGCEKACAPKAEAPKGCGGCEKACAPKACCQKACAPKACCQKACKKVCAGNCASKCGSCKGDSASCDQAHRCGEDHAKSECHKQCCWIGSFFGRHNGQRGACATGCGSCEHHGWVRCQHRHITAAEQTVR